MNRFLFFLLFIIPLTLWGRSIVVVSKIKINKDNPFFEAVYTTKRVWNPKEVSYLDKQFKFGKVPASGSSRGITLFLQPNGAWGLNIGDGENRIDYLPSALQKLKREKEYTIKLMFDFTRMDLWIYVDENQKAVYNLEQLKLSMKDYGLMLQTLHVPKNQGIEVTQLHINPIKKLVIGEPAHVPGDKIKVISLNTHNGGMYKGIPDGIKVFIARFETESADVICLQDMADVGVTLADFGNYYYYRIDRGKAILSKFPITKTYKEFETEVAGGCQVGAKGKLINIFNVVLHEQPREDSLPAFKKKYIPPAKLSAKKESKDSEPKKPKKGGKKKPKKEDKTVWIADTVKILAMIYPYDTLVQATRMPQIKEVMKTIKTLNLVLPTIVAGTFHEPSYLDWTKEQVEGSGSKMVYDRPVSRFMDRLGYTDSFKKGAVGRNPGITCRKNRPVRIDYLYAKRLKVLTSYTGGFEDSKWSSQHAMVISTFKLP